MRLFWIIFLGPKCNHKGPNKEKRELRSKGDIGGVTSEARGWIDVRKGS